MRRRLRAARAVATAVVVAAVAAAAGCRDCSERAPAAPVDPNALVEGKLPAGQDADLVQARCAFCHSIEYLTQQRLTTAQWEKSIAKMRRFGAPISDEESAALLDFLSHLFGPDLPEAHHREVPTPAAALPAP